MSVRHVTALGVVDPRAARRAVNGAIPRFPGGERDGAVVRERGLRRVAQAEHGEAVIARDEADGEHAAGASPGRRLRAGREVGPGKRPRSAGSGLMRN
jgi:hypothetical protein